MAKKFEFTENDIRGLSAEVKVGLLATITPAGLPHITLITSLMAGKKDQVIFGQFSEGLSKKNVKENPNTAFLVMTMDRKLWRGKARWTHVEKQGPEFEMFNNIPMFRYNSYFGIHTVHYMDLVEVSGPTGLPLLGMLGSVLSSRIFGAGKTKKSKKKIMNAWTRKFFNRLDVIKFVAFKGIDGFPRIIPCIGLKASGNDRLVFSPLGYKDEFALIPRGQKVAVFGLSMKMEDVLVRGDFWGFDGLAGNGLGIVDIDYVYNSMPPTPGTVYPRQKLEPVRVFT